MNPIILNVTPFLQADGFLSGLRAALEAEHVAVREGALLAFTAICNIGRTALECHLLPWLPALLKLISDDQVYTNQGVLWGRVGRPRFRALATGSSQAFPRVWELYQFGEGNITCEMV